MTISDMSCMGSKNTPGLDKNTLSESESCVYFVMFDCTTAILCLKLVLLVYEVLLVYFKGQVFLSQHQWRTVQGKVPPQ